MSTQAVVWKLKAGTDRRFRAGHPWVYSNELAASPKGIQPGDPIELQDPSGKVLARGYGNPSSLIAFRTLTRNPEVTDPWSAPFLLSKLEEAWKLRLWTGWDKASYRLCYGEADGLPGLVIDRYLTSSEHQVFVIQAHTAGANRMVAALPEVLAEFSKKATQVSWDKTAIVLRNDVGFRKLEGLTEEEPRILKEAKGLKLEDCEIRLATGLALSTNLFSGQKTGFYLDQVANIQLALERLKQIPDSFRKIKILDLCCYVGQWSAHFTQLFKQQGRQVEVVVVDSSQAALNFAERNIGKAGANDIDLLKGDILQDLASLPANEFDLVISDPPALIKGRKDVPAGKHAYLQLNTQVFRLLKKGGAVVTCSCSGLLEEEEFLAALTKAAARNQRTMRWIGKGGHGPDHPMLSEFPEGRYLKCWIGIDQTS